MRAGVIFVDADACGTVWIPLGQLIYKTVVKLPNRPFFSRKVVPKLT